MAPTGFVSNATFVPVTINSSMVTRNQSITIAPSIVVSNSPINQTNFTSILPTTQNQLTSISLSTMAPITTAGMTTIAPTTAPKPYSVILNCLKKKLYCLLIPYIKRNN